MQDRFKFRVFDKNTNKMYDVRSMSYVNEIVKRIEVQDEERILIFDEWENNIDNTILIQCTGLKDKNGKLIYEGDIVKINTHYNHLVCDDYEYDCESEKGYSLFKIIYDDDMARFGAERIKCVKWETHHYSLDYVPHNHKVIRNIYENSELIGGEQC